MDQSEIKAHVFPNLFYDIIVFLTPTLTVLIGIGIGLGLVDDVWGAISRGQGSTLSVVVLSLVVFFVGYEYGRLAETFSDTLVALPLRSLKRFGFVSKDSDFGKKLEPQVMLLGIESSRFFGRTSSKWTLYFFAMQNAPLIGADLLKRYAWEKLSRSAGFSFCIISIFSSLTILTNFVAGTSHFEREHGFGTVEYLIVSLVLYLMCLVDYFRRNSWNNDLLITTIPVIVEDVRKREMSARLALEHCPCPQAVALASRHDQGAAPVAIPSGKPSIGSAEEPTVT